MEALTLVILKLTVCVAYLSSPAYQTDLAFKAHADSYITEAFQDTAAALAPYNASGTALTEVVIPTLGSASSSPVVETSTPAVPPIETSTPPAPAQIVKTQTGWDQGAKPFGQLGIVSLESELPGDTTTLFEYHANRGLYESAVLTINGTDYPMTITNIGGGQSSVAQLILDRQTAGLTAGHPYPFSVRIDTAERYATKTGTITIP